MNERSYARLDAASLVLLLLWSGAGLGFGLLVAPVVFQTVPSRDLAGLAMGKVLARLDIAAWIAFGGALALSVGSRWMHEFREAGPVGPLRLWMAAALAALLMCMSSTFILTPRLNEVRTRMAAPVETFSPDHPDRVLYNRVHRFSRQMFILRLLLALGLAWGTTRLPRRSDGPETESAS